MSPVIASYENRMLESKSKTNAYRNISAVIRFGYFLGLIPLPDCGNKQGPSRFKYVQKEYENNIINFNSYEFYCSVFAQEHMFILC